MCVKKKIHNYLYKILGQERQRNIGIYRLSWTIKKWWNGCYIQKRTSITSKTFRPFLYNWALQKVNSTDLTFFRVDAGPKERLIFKNNIERKIINVDLEYIKKHPELDVKRIPINIRNRDGSKDIIGEEQTNKAKFIVTHTYWC